MQASQIFRHFKKPRIGRGTGAKVNRAPVKIAAKLGDVDVVAVEKDCAIVRQRIY